MSTVIPAQGGVAPGPRHLNHFAISVERQGTPLNARSGFARRFGVYSEIRTADYEFAFNLNGEIKFIRGLRPDWPHPAEQLKRTDGNDWVYYTVGDKGGDAGISKWTGEYYLPCLPYPSNGIWEVNYMAIPAVMNAFAAWSQLYADLYCADKTGAHPKKLALVDAVLANNDQVLHERARQLFDITGGRVSVLPPDTRHVDYEVIPLMIADGCRYRCRFCCVKSDRPFAVRDMDDIHAQIRRLRAFYGHNLANCNAVFLGNHDALAAGVETITAAAAAAREAFGLEGKDGVRPKLYLFGSVGALLAAGAGDIDRLDRLPFDTVINIGFESADPATLKAIGKPLTADAVREAFARMGDINAGRDHVEITGNFILGEDLPPAHEQTLGDLLAGAAPPADHKGGVYLSPLKDSPKKRELLPRLMALKQRSRLPLFAYLIQRL